MPNIFGTIYNPATGKFAAFNADTGVVYSTHDSDLEAMAAVRRYQAAQFRRLRFNPLADLAHSAI